MKKIVVVIYFVAAGFRASAQAEELKQLALNIEKLAQFKQILADLKKAYGVLYGGYTTIKNISEGNFNLHETFLNGLLEASPAVKKYKKIADIISLQVRLVKEYKSAFTRFKNSGHFTIGELDYMGKVYGRLFNESLKHLDELATVLTANKLRMSDDERLKTIDKIYAGMAEEMSFLRHFNNGNSLLGIQRSHEQHDVDVMRRLHDIR
jgi:DNA repair ATPase RecN